MGVGRVVTNFLVPREAVSILALVVERAKVSIVAGAIYRIIITQAIRGVTGANRYVALGAGGRITNDG